MRKDWPVNSQAPTASPVVCRKPTYRLTVKRSVSAADRRLSTMAGREGAREPRELAIQQQTGFVGRLGRLLIARGFRWRRYRQQFSETEVARKGTAPAGAVATVLGAGFTEENKHTRLLGMTIHGSEEAPQQGNSV